MVSDAEVRNFLKMSVFQKTKLQQENPAKYDELKKEAAKRYNPNTDAEAAQELAKK